MKKIIGLILKEKGNKSVSIIGAGDGPTSVFLAGKIGRDYSVFTFIIRKSQNTSSKQLKVFNHRRSQLMISYWYVTDH